ncbi:rps2 [Symbiodinium sp. CCMP2592]|nr:rps2 [Symbiodinium sp. CCMP2592]
MFAPSQQSMSAAEQQETKTWLTSVAFTSATIEAFEKHALGKNQLAYLEDTHLKQMNICIGDQLRIKKAAQELKKEEARQQAMQEAERANKIVATFADKFSCCGLPCTPFQHHRTTWQMSEAGIVEHKGLGLGKGVKQNNIDFAQVADVDRQSSGCGGCLGTVTLTTTTSETYVLKTDQSKVVFDDVKKHWQAAKAAGTA